MAQGEIKFKISRSAYTDAIRELGQEMIDLQRVHEQYDNLKNRLKNELVGEGDDNYQSLIESVETNMKTIRKSFAMARENRDMLQRQLDAMESNSSAVGELIASGIEMGQSAANTIALADDLID